MKADKKTFDVLESIKEHIETLKPLLPKQAIICVGEYPLKIMLKEPYLKKAENAVSILVGKSSDEVYKWVPKGFEPYLVSGFEDAKIDTHFWYDVLPYTSKDDTLVDELKKKSVEKLGGSILVASVWDGIGSALLPTLISKLKASNINSLSLAVLPSKIQPSDADFNALASLGMCGSIEGSTVLLMDRDHIESYEGIDRSGFQMKGNAVLNYLVSMFVDKVTLVEEVSEFSRTFNNKMYTLLLASGVSLRIYGSLESILNATLLKQFLTFDLSSASLLYVLLRMPTSLKDKLPRGKIELAIANWFKEKAKLKSIYITEPIYVDDTNDRIDLALFVGGFDISNVAADLGGKIQSLKANAFEKGFIKEEEWQNMMKNLETVKE
jgi:hypothetical protein